MGKGSREEKKPKKDTGKKGNASAPSVKDLPAGLAKPGAAAKKK